MEKPQLKTSLLSRVKQSYNYLSYELAEQPQIMCGATTAPDVENNIVEKISLGQWQHHTIHEGSFIQLEFQMMRSAVALPYTIFNSNNNKEEEHQHHLICCRYAC